MTTETVRVNEGVAARLLEVASLLESQGASRFRVEAYRRGADVVRGLERPVDEILAEGGLEALIALPSIGESLARAIRMLVRTGRLPMLDRLRGESDPIGLLTTVPGIGVTLAERLHHELGIETLEELETAVHSGSLLRVGGFGAKRLVGIRDHLAERLGRVRRSRVPNHAPSVAELLDVDREYRSKADAGALPQIAPRRFNPAGEAWLPVLHTRRGDREYTALFSNTALAHKLRRTRDWVVIYVDGGGPESRFTVVTARTGSHGGERVVRGREGES